MKYVIILGCLIVVAIVFSGCIEQEVVTHTNQREPVQIFEKTSVLHYGIHFSGTVIDSDGIIYTWKDFRYSPTDFDNHKVAFKFTNNTNPADYGADYELRLLTFDYTTGKFV